MAGGSVGPLCKILAMTLGQKMGLSATEGGVLAPRTRARPGAPGEKGVWRHRARHVLGWGLRLDVDVALLNIAGALRDSFLLSLF